MKNTIIILILAFFCSTLRAQTARNNDSLYYTKYDEYTKHKDSAWYFRPPVKPLSNAHYQLEEYYTSNGELKERTEYKDVSLYIKEGTSASFFENGNKKFEGTYRDNELIDEARYYFEKNGNLRRKVMPDSNSYYDIKDYYSAGTIFRHQIYNQKNKLIEKKCYGVNGTDTIYVADRSCTHFSDKKNAFNKYILDNRVYPEYCKKRHIEGTVVAKVFFDTTGKPNYIAIIEPVHPLLAEETKRLLLNGPSWLLAFYEPGRPETLSSYANITYRTSETGAFLLSPLSTTLMAGLNNFE